MPGLVKVGYSMQDPQLRAQELDHVGIPHPYVVEYQMLTEEPFKVEQEAHRILKSVREGKEWFRCAIQKAVEAIQDVAGEKAIYQSPLEIDKKSSHSTPEEDAQKFVDKGSDLLGIDKFKEGLDCFEAALRITQRCQMALYGKGVALEKLGRLEEALESYDRVLEINPQLAAAWYCKGGIFDHFGQFEKAIECYDKVLKIDPQMLDTWYNKGVVLSHLGRFGDAIKCYDESLILNMKNEKVWESKGIALGESGRLKEALACFEKALEIKPTFGRAWYDMGHTLLKLGKEGKAIKAYREFIKYAGPEEAELAAEIRRLIGAKWWSKWW